MTVAVQDPINQFVITSVSQTSGVWSWQLNAAADLTVFKQLVSTGEVVPLTLDTDYSVAAGDLGSKTGGTITFLAPQLPTVVGDIWTLQRDTVLNRSKDFATSGDFQAVTVNPQMDDPILMAQDTQRDGASALRKDPGVGSVLNPLIPQPVNRRTLIFESDGEDPVGYDIVMSDEDPDGAAASASEAAASAAAALVSEGNANTFMTQAALSADDAASSAVEAANSAASAAGLYHEVVAITGDKTLVGTDDGFLISCDTSSGQINIDLPDSSALSADWRCGIIVTDNTNDVVVSVQGSDTVNGGTSDIVISSLNKLGTFVLDQSAGEYVASIVESIQTDDIEDGAVTPAKTSFNVLTLDTPQTTTSGSVKTFSDIPAGTTKITVSFFGVSAGSGSLFVRIGDSGGIEATGYINTSFRGVGGSSANSQTSTTSFDLFLDGDSDTAYGHLFLNLADSSTNSWTSSHSLRLATNKLCWGGGGKSLSEELTQLTVNSTSTFDAGKVNISYH